MWWERWRAWEGWSSVRNGGVWWEGWRCVGGVWWEGWRCVGVVEDCGGRDKVCGTRGGGECGRGGMDVGGGRRRCGPSPWASRVGQPI